MLLTRNAGSEQHLTATVTFAQIEHDIPADSTASLLIDDRDLGSLDAVDDSHFRLDSDQTAALLQALANQRKIEFTLNGQHLPLSSAGSREVLGKMDAFQRRTGTADALLDKGDAGDDAILPAAPAPEIIAAPVIHNAQPVPLNMLQRQKLLPSLTPLLNQRCEDWQNPAIPAAERQITLTALDKTHSLAQALCWRAPYNDGYALWLVDNAQLSKPRLLTTEASSYANGTLVNTGNATLRILAYGPCLKPADGKECKENYFLMPGKERRFTRVNVADKKGRVALWQGEQFVPVK